jgi:carboxymethylenebutenolidase
MVQAFRHWTASEAEQEILTIMKIRVFAITMAAIVISSLAVKHAVNLPANSASGTPAAVHSTLPSQTIAKMLLNSTHRHREWVNVPVGSAGVRAFIVYPERSDNAPVVMVTASKQGASDWIRAVADQIAAEGFIAVVPDVLSGLGPFGGDTNSFASPEAVAAALDRMGRDEITRRTNAVRDYALSVPAADKKTASLEFDAGNSRIQAAVEKPVAGEPAATFQLTAEAWPQAVAFLTRQTGNQPVVGANPNVPEDHSAHMMMAMAQAPDGKKGGGGGRGYPAGKFPELPAGTFTAHSTLLHSQLRKEFVDIPMGSVKLHTWIEYPPGEGKAPIVIVMQHGPGMDDWQRALADQLAQQGFIAIAADLHSGLGPNGGAYDSFGGSTDEVMRATARITQDDMQARYKAARDYGLKLARSNGKSASIGFCMGGDNSFRFAAEVPELDAAVSFYGATPSKELLAKIKALVLAFYGEDDARVTAANEPTIASMKELGKSFESHVYPHATHGFLEFQDLGGNPAATSDSWPRTIAFLKQHTM